jgi:uncharacterized protein with PIN domain
MPLSEPAQNARFRFYAELNDFFLNRNERGEITYSFHGSPSVKDAIEAMGVPHTEVDLIVANGLSVDFNHHLQHGDYISVFPVFECLDISPIIHLREKPLRTTRFILDVHLGKLARNLRMLGFDSLYRNDYHDEEIVSTALREKRIILTRDRGILKIKTVTHGYCIRSLAPLLQITEVLKRFDLYSQVDPFSRCISCNGILAPVEKKAIAHRLEQKTKEYYDEFSICSACGKLFWKGTHYYRMKRFIDQLMDH